VIVGARSDEPLIRRKRAGADPVIVRIDGEEELAIGNLMNLERLVVGSRENELAVGRDRDGANGSRVLLDDLRVTFDSVVP